MNGIKRLLAVALCLGALSACSTAPVGRLDKIHAMAPVTGTKSVSIQAPGLLYQDRFELTVWNLGDGPDVVPVEIALSDDALHFVRWREDGQLYVPVQTIPLSEIVRVKRYTYLTAPFLGVESTGYKFNAFMLSGRENQPLLDELHRELSKYARAKP